MFKNVLVGVDGSPSGRDAVALAKSLMDPNASLTLAHVHGGQLNPLHVVTPGLVEQERASSEQLLEQERERAQVQAQLISIVGSSPGAALHKRAEEQDADLLIVGSSSRGPLGRAMLGDDTRQALNGAPCAVAIASRRYAEEGRPLTRVGAGYVETPEGHAALDFARRLGAAHGARVSALEVITIPTYAYTGLVAPTFGEDLDRVLADANARLARLAEVEARAVYGLTGEELASFGEGLDLLIVGSRSYGPLRRLVLGSTSDYLERHTRCSLLVLPRAAAAADGAHNGARAQRDARAPGDAPALHGAPAAV
jgi:nucleotide-binding universal stress UspA family protein